MKSLSSVVVTALVLLSSVLATTASAQNHAYGLVTGHFGSHIHGAVSDLGVGSVRFGATWAEVEPQQDQWNWGAMDQWFNDAAARGLTIYWTLAYTPSWAGPCSDGHCMPYNINDWYDFVYQAISRYGWYDKIVFGIWNEPNLGFLSPGDGYLTKIAKYKQLYEYANMARNAVNANAALGGPETSHHASEFEWDLYNVNIEAYRKPHDIVTAHWYHDGPYFPTYMDKKVDNANGRQVWLTEFGHSVCEPPGGEQGQVERYDWMLNYFIFRGRTDWQRIFAYKLESGGCDEGILRPDLSRRPVFDYYQNFIATHP